MRNPVPIYIQLLDGASEDELLDPNVPREDGPVFGPYESFEICGPVIRLGPTHSLDLDTMGLYYYKGLYYERIRLLTEATGEKVVEFDPEFAKRPYSFFNRRRRSAPERLGGLIVLLLVFSMWAMDRLIQTMLDLLKGISQTTNRKTSSVENSGVRDV